MIGKAIYDGILIELRLAPFFLRKMLGKVLTDPLFLPLSLPLSLVASFPSGRRRKTYLSPFTSRMRHSSTEMPSAPT